MSSPFLHISLGLGGLFSLCHNKFDVPINNYSLNFSVFCGFCLLVLIFIYIFCAEELNARGTRILFGFVFYFFQFLKQGLSV